MKKGDFTSWMSQSKGTTTVKQGHVICIVPAGYRPKLNALKKRGYKINRLGKNSGGRTYDSYLVDVKGYAYWPR